MSIFPNRQALPGIENKSPGSLFDPERQSMFSGLAHGLRDYQPAPLFSFQLSKVYPRYSNPYMGRIISRSRQDFFC
jgi:hypothetical protein